MAKKRATEVRFWLNTQEDPTYFLSIFYDSGLVAWNISILSLDNEKVICEIDCKSLPTFIIS